MAHGGLVLRYGGFYGHGASGDLLGPVRKRQMPIVGGGTGLWSFCEITDAAAATVAASPRRLPAWLARPLAGEMGVSMMTDIRGSSDAKAKRLLGWTPRYKVEGDEEAGGGKGFQNG